MRTLLINKLQWKLKCGIVYEADARVFFNTFKVALQNTIFIVCFLWYVIIL